MDFVSVLITSSPLFLLDDASISALNAKNNQMLPFAVVGSMDEVKIGNRMVRARQYPWGTVQVSLSCKRSVEIDFGNLSKKTSRQNIRKVRLCRKNLKILKVESEAHCDFVHLREMLLRTNLEDLRSSTHTKHYELYRRNKLCEMGFNDDTHSNSFNLQEVYETKRHEHMRNMQDKEDEMRQVCYFDHINHLTPAKFFNTKNFLTLENVQTLKIFCPKKL